MILLETDMPENKDASIEKQEARIEKALKISDRQNELEADSDSVVSSTDTPKEVNGPKGLEPTRYGDWENNGRCYDF